MKPINEVYPECIGTSLDGEEYFNYPFDYTPLLDSFGYTTLLQVDDDDFQGDSRLLFQDGTRCGLLIFGWGSCSGCDALQSCESIKEIEDLRSSLLNSIKWFDTPAECLHYFNTHDWRGDYSWHDKETGKFVADGIRVLGELIDPTSTQL